MIQNIILVLSQGCSPSAKDLELETWISKGLSVVSCGLFLEKSFKNCLSLGPYPISYRYIQNCLALSPKWDIFIKPHPGAQGSLGRRQRNVRSSGDRWLEEHTVCGHSRAELIGAHTAVTGRHQFKPYRFQYWEQEVDTDMGLHP